MCKNVFVSSGMLNLNSVINHVWLNACIADVHLHYILSCTVHGDLSLTFMEPSQLDW